MPINESNWPALARLKPNNAQGEYYLTDVIADFVSQGAELPTLSRDPAWLEG